MRRLRLLFALSFLLSPVLACAAGGGSSSDDETNDSGDGDGDGDLVGDGDGDGDLVGDGDAPASGGTGFPGSGGAGTSSGGNDSSSGGSEGASCTPGTGTEDVGTNSFLDRATCLVWQKSDTHVGSISNREAAAHCQSLTQDGITWRLPTGPELRSYPNLPDNGNAYIAGPTFISSSASDEASGCIENSHTCNITQYNPGTFACAWQGPGGGGYPVLCVSGTADASSLDMSFSAATCCPTSVSMFEEADCGAY